MALNPIAELYRAGTLHSGPAAIVFDKATKAKQILIAYLKKRGQP